MASSRICSIPDCDKPCKARGWCWPHYQRWRKHGDPEGGGPSLPHGKALRYFNETVLTYEGDECLVWPFYRDPDGYGRLSYEGRTQPVSRVVCKRFNGPPPTAKHEAAHSCGNSGCANKRHIRWATSFANKADTLLHGTRSRGERVGNSKLTESDIRAIRAAKGTASQAAIGKQFGVSQSLIGHILRGGCWSWLD